MKPLIRTLLAPVAVAALAATLAWFFIQREDRPGLPEVAKNPAAAKANLLALRIAAIDSAKKSHQMMLATERVEFAREKQESDFPELAELGHEVRLLRIDLEHQKRLAAIDRQFPPPNPAPSAQPVP